MEREGREGEVEGERGKSGGGGGGRRGDSVGRLSERGREGGRKRRVSATFSSFLIKKIHTKNHFFHYCILFLFYRN